MRSNEHIADPKYCSPQDSGYEECGEVAVVEVTNAVVDPWTVEKKKPNKVLFLVR